MDNTHSRFSAKLVYIYFASIVLSEWEQYTKDLEQFDVSVGNVTVSWIHILYLNSTCVCAEEAWKHVSNFPKLAMKLSDILYIYAVIN